MVDELDCAGKEKAGVHKPNTRHVAMASWCRRRTNAHTRCRFLPRPLCKYGRLRTNSCKKLRWHNGVDGRAYEWREWHTQPKNHAKYRNVYIRNKRIHSCERVWPTIQTHTQRKVTAATTTKNALVVVQFNNDQEHRHQDKVDNVGPIK